MTSRQNYKAKWLAALSEKQTLPTDDAAKIEKDAINIREAHTTATTQLRRLQTVMFEGAHAATRLNRVMDECRNVAGVEFGECVHEVDGKLGSLDMVVIARRLRDTIKVAEMRIGILTAAVDNIMEANQRIFAEVDMMGSHATLLQQAAVETLLIGNNPSEREMEDYQEHKTGTRFIRHNLEYQDMDEGYIVTQLSPHTQIRAQLFEDTASIDESDESASNDSAEEFRERALTHRRNRSAIVVPTDHRTVDNDITFD